MAGSAPERRTLDEPPVSGMPVERQDLDASPDESALPVRFRPSRSAEIDGMPARVSGVRRLGGSFAVVAYPV